MVLSLASSFSIKKLRPNDRPHHLSPIYFEFGPHRRQSKDSLSYSNLFNLEGNGLSDEHMHHDESAEHSSLVASHGDPLDSELVVSINGDDLKQQEEESRRRIELDQGRGKKA
ncbi:PREDICTED: uncharacterized protein LOC101305088 [Fragaria vesca subsp. vesca]|uniref:uncharacterized protein LOC101305088 n=1 Tax=Fragaria vesca subsp. vesca TaxID=101020 RepID=UPI0002C30A23|nr:PREDICTED: uncharacterized protein LOC101305088 [Fragaria vesca subsp. vesca]